MKPDISDKLIKLNDLSAKKIIANAKIWHENTGKNLITNLTSIGKM